MNLAGMVVKYNLNLIQKFLGGWGGASQHPTSLKSEMIPRANPLWEKRFLI